MAENALQTAQSFMQDVLAPDVRELKVKVNALDKRIDSVEKHMDRRFDEFEKRMDERFKVVDERFKSAQERNDANIREVLSAIKQLQLANENYMLRSTAELRERVAVLESRAA